ncbi:MAG: ATP-binding protein, partial [Clostridia bacterium]|nr:ATP-binding protein [Clostridia bacterium]
VRGGAALFQRLARLLLAHPEQAEALARQTREQAAEGDRALRARLRALGYPETYLAPIYRCAVCRDTGYVGEGVREECACFRQRVSQRLYDEAFPGTGAAQTFEAYDESIFPDDEKVDGLYTQKQRSLMVRDLCRDYAASYPHTQRPGLLLMGNTGLGKTFLLNCVLNELIGRGFAPVKVTGYRLFEIMRGAHFGEADKQADFRQMLDCDPLMIDDLGTEPMMQNITREYLFTLLNERQTQRRHTVLATNLNHTDLMARYGERLLSRLMDSLSIQIVELKGKDLRLFGRRK